MLAIRPRRGDNDGEVWVGRNLSAALSLQIHTAQHLFPPGTGAPCLHQKRKNKKNKKKAFRTPLSELLVSELAFDIEPRGAIPGITSENKSGRGRSEQLVAIGEEGKLGKELGKDRNMERTAVTEKNKLTPFDIIWGEISTTYTV